jgi:hypothetical protein
MVQPRPPASGFVQWSVPGVLLLAQLSVVPNELLQVAL